jgi:hypothetical protein
MKTEEEILDLLDVLEAKIDKLDDQIKIGEREVKMLEDESREIKVQELNLIRAEKLRINRIINEQLEILKVMSKKNNS